MLSIAGGRYRVQLGAEILDTTLRGRFKQEDQRRVLVGDRVTVATHPDGSQTIEDLLPRTSVLRRRTPGGGRGVRRIAANLDRVIVVGSADRPLWDPRLIDRFVVVAQANALPAVVVANKADLAEDVPHLLTPYREAGYPTLVTSVRTGRGIEEFRDLLAGHTSLLTGPTGVGKSSLLNAVQPGLRLRTGTVSPRSGAGRHTTVSAEMHPLAGGGFVVDTPGLRDIGLWGMQPAEVQAAFPELGALAAHCRFDDCRHLEEPGCAVTEAARDGTLAPSRLESYRKLLEEAQAAAHPWRSRPKS